MKEGAVDKGASVNNGQKKCSSYAMPFSSIQQQNGNQQTKAGDLFTTTDSPNASIMTSNNNHLPSFSSSITAHSKLDSRSSRTVKTTSRLQMHHNSVVPELETCYVKIVEDSRADSLELVLEGSHRVVAQRQMPQMGEKPAERSMKKAVFRGARKVEGRPNQGNGVPALLSQSSVQEKEELSCEMVIPTPARLNNQMILAVDFQVVKCLVHLLYYKHGWPPRIYLQPLIHSYSMLQRKLGHFQQRTVEARGKAP